MIGGEWDTRVQWLPKKQAWWWNAWREATATELWGFAESKENALRAMVKAMRDAGYPDPFRLPGRGAGLPSQPRHC